MTAKATNQTITHAAPISFGAPIRYMPEMLMTPEHPQPEARDHQSGRKLAEQEHGSAQRRLATQGLRLRNIL